MRVFALIAVIGVMAAFGGTAARADAFKGDPRKCTFNVPAQCANQAAVLNLRRYMAAKTGHPWSGHGDIQWTADITCRSLQANSLKWRCSWTTTAGTSLATVWFRALSTGWKRVVTLAP